MTLILFADRNLGKRFVTIVREASIEIIAHAEHFSDNARDEEWLAKAGAEGWFCISLDARIRYRPNERDAVMHAGVGLFILAGRASHQDLAENFVRTFPKIKRFTEKHNRPFIAKVYRPPASIRERYPGRPGRVELWLSYERWLKRNL